VPFTVISENIKGIVMKKIFLSVLALCTIASLGIVSAGDKTTEKKTKSLSIVTDVWEPYTGPAESSQGYCVEIVKAIFHKAGYNITYKVLPFSRAIIEVRTGKSDIAVGLYKDNAPDLIFPKDTIGKSINRFYVKKGDRWRYTGVQSMKGRTLGVIQGYTYDELDPYIKANKNDESKVQIMFGETPLAANIKKLMAGRVSVIIDDQLVVESTARRLGRSFPVAINEAGMFGQPHPVYITFSPALEKKAESAKLSAIFDEEIKKMRSSGELKSILKKYNVPDWK